MEYYENKIQDAPLKDINKFRVTPWPGLQYCPIADADDPEVPFAEGIDHNEMVEEDFSTSKVKELISQGETKTIEELASTKK
jgi:hypothetical protein